jgi:hypothetical protein
MTPNPSMHRTRFRGPVISNASPKEKNHASRS